MLHEHYTESADIFFRTKATVFITINYLYLFRALKEYIGSIDSNYVKEVEDFYIGFEGSFGSRHVTARTLAAHYLGNLVCLEGIVTKCSLVSQHIKY